MALNTKCSVYIKVEGVNKGQMKTNKRKYHIYKSIFIVKCIGVSCSALCALVFVFPGLVATNNQITRNTGRVGAIILKLNSQENFIYYLIVLCSIICFTAIIHFIGKIYKSKNKDDIEYWNLGKY
jgi:hypothetical protein